MYILKRYRWDLAIELPINMFYQRQVKKKKDLELLLEIGTVFH